MTQRRKILIVDDEQSFVGVLKERLQFEGFWVATAGDGHQGLNSARDHRPEVILLDLMMPGMDGFEFTRRLRQEDDLKAIPTIYVTAYGRAPDDEQRQVMGAAPVVRKPFEMEQLMYAIRGVLA